MWGTEPGWHTFALLVFTFVKSAVSVPDFWRSSYDEPLLLLINIWCGKVVKFQYCNSKYRRRRFCLLLYLFEWFCAWRETSFTCITATFRAGGESSWTVWSCTNIIETVPAVFLWHLQFYKCLKPILCGTWLFAASSTQLLIMKRRECGWMGAFYFLFKNKWNDW